MSPCEKGGCPTTFNEQSNMDDVGGRWHDKSDILETRSLAGGPMHASASCSWSYVGSIDDKISDLAVKDVCRDPVEVRSVVMISVNKSKSLETSSSLQSWRVAGVANHHRHVGRQNRPRDQVRACWEVHNSGCPSCRCLECVRNPTHPVQRYSEMGATYTALATSVPRRGYSGVNGSRVIGDTITYAKFLDTIPLRNKTT